jgi:hypothetical protein
VIQRFPKRNEFHSSENPLVLHLLSRKPKMVLLKPFEIKFIRGPRDISKWRAKGRESQIEAFQLPLSSELEKAWRGPILRQAPGRI